MVHFLSSESLALVIQTSDTKDFGRFSKVGKKPGQVLQMVSAHSNSSNNLGVN